jgi:hypothetical protein
MADKVSFWPETPPRTSSKVPSARRPVSWGGFRRLRFEGDFADGGREVQISDFRVR